MNDAVVHHALRYKADALNNAPEGQQAQVFAAYAKHVPWNLKRSLLSKLNVKAKERDLSDIDSQFLNNIAFKVFAQFDVYNKFYILERI